MKRILTLTALLFAVSFGVLRAQQYSGMSGMIQIPSAEMDASGQARIGAHFLNGELTPDHKYWADKAGKKYPTFDFYLSITPFSWVEIGYTMTLFKRTGDIGADDKPGYNKKDRYLSLKFRVLKEGKWWPAVAIGGADFLNTGFFKGNPFKHTSVGSNDFWRNYYLAVTKHLECRGNEFGANLAYRYYTATYNHRWQGVVGGVTWRPWFARGGKILTDMRVMAEWDGCEVNVGVDCILWKRLMLQASLQNGKYPSAGVCYTVNLF